MDGLVEVLGSLVGSWQVFAVISLVLVILLSRSPSSPLSVWPRQQEQGAEPRHVAESKAVLETEKVGKDLAMSELSPAELARILGNSSPEDEDLPPSDGDRVEEVFSEGAAAAAREAGEALLRAMEGQDSQLALQLVQEATPTVLNFVDAENRNALLLGATEGHTEACQLLLERADFVHVDALNSIGSTALHLAAANDHVEICKALITSCRFTASVNVENNSGQTPLDFSLDFGEGTAADVLMAAGGQRNTSGTLRARRKARGPVAPDEGLGSFPGYDDEANCTNALD